MRRILLATVAALSVSLTNPTASCAIDVECLNCSDLFTQLLEKATQAQQLATQVQQYQTQLSQYANMITNTVALPMEVFAGVQNDIMQVRSLTNAASVLTGNTGSILNRLQSAQGYANQASFLPQNIGGQFTMWQQTLGNASSSLGRTLGVQQGQEQSYTALQAAIQAHSQTAAGQMQAIQAGNEMAALTNTQLQQIQTTLTATATQANTVDILAANRTASEDAATLHFFQPPPPLPTTGYLSYGANY